VIIPDLNVLLYTVDSSSVRHEEAVSWLEATVNSRKEEIGLPLVVMLGFLRLSTNPKVFASPLSVQESLEWIRELREAPGVFDIHPGKAHMGILGHLLLASGTGGNLTTDAHLAALALEHDAAIATGDRDFQRFPGLKVKLLF
jgi:toxin-antitoxin system PIN domain toxin